MLYKGILISAASGRIGDAVASHNRGGAYFRSIGNPNPNAATSAQTALRQAMADTRAEWLAMTDEQRAGWAEYSSMHKRSGRIGTMRSIGAFQEFARSNVVRFYANAVLSTSLFPVLDAPTYTSEPFTGIRVAAAAAGTQVQIDYDGTADWVAKSDAAMLVWASPPLSGTVNYYRSPMTLIGAVLGAAGQPDPENFTAPGTTTTGQARAIKVRVTRESGILSDEYWTRCVQA